MTPDETMDDLAPKIRAVFQELIPKGMHVLVVLYDGHERMMNIANTDGRNVHIILKTALDILEAQLTVTQTYATNDNGSS